MDGKIVTFSISQIAIGKGEHFQHKEKKLRHHTFKNLLKSSIFDFVYLVVVLSLTAPLFEIIMFLA